MWADLSGSGQFTTGIRFVLCGFESFFHFLDKTSVKSLDDGTLEGIATDPDDLKHAARYGVAANNSKFDQRAASCRHIVRILFLA